MKSQSAEAILAEIDSTISEINSFPHSSFIEQAYLAKFLVVFISGIYEESIERIINDMTQRLGKNEISSFIEKSISNNFRNPNIENVKKLLSKFGNNLWIDEINTLSEEIKNSFNSINSNKNALAHGTPVSITLSDVTDYYHKSRCVIEKIDDLLL
ncbi:hypothetical protein KA107_03880 [Candidatus Pacearchaeota archaeon]|nr:hypothetical protein [Candidatus Pacearchaeota archaeon]